ncbi:MAG: DUF4159 domain-containing protein [Flavobacteriaceae bacterium]|nr:DUF4159 domain-containing protein [Flavobacteriaceae bacterium]
MRFISYLLFIFITTTSLNAQELAVLQYGGGGDWYSNPTALPNLVKFCNEHINTALSEKTKVVRPENIDIFDFPIVHMTGHGNVFFTDEETKNLQDYLISGGFLHIDDNYGMDQYVRKEIKKLFPNTELKELSASHPIFNYHFKFPEGLPKIHEHNNIRPQAMGITIGERLVLLYTFESDLGDGWENPEIHNDPQEVRLKALQMGANIVKFAFEN